jgi:SAP domain-containing ribonucleoprotein
VAAERAALVALVEADIQKRKERAERFGTPFEPTELDKKRLECAREGRPMPGSKEEAEANARRKKLPKPKQQQGEKGASRDARFQNERKKTKGVASKEDKCRNCGKAGHWARDCWAPGGGKEGQKPGQQKKGQKGQQQQQQAKKQPQQQQQQNKRKSEGDAKEAREAKMKKRYEAFGTSAALKEVDP